MELFVQNSDGDLKRVDISKLKEQWVVYIFDNNAPIDFDNTPYFANSRQEAVEWYEDWAVRQKEPDNYSVVIRKIKVIDAF